MMMIITRKCPSREEEMKISTGNPIISIRWQIKSHSNLPSSSSTRTSRDLSSSYHLSVFNHRVLLGCLLMQYQKFNTLKFILVISSIVTPSL